MSMMIDVLLALKSPMVQALLAAQQAPAAEQKLTAPGVVLEISAEALRLSHLAQEEAEAKAVKPVGPISGSDAQQPFKRP